LYNDYFRLILPALSSHLEDAQLSVKDYSVGNPSGIENFLLFDVNNEITAPTNTQATANNIYADLGSGKQFRSRSVFSSESGMFSSIPLNSSFVAAALTNGGGQIALGGTLGDLFRTNQ
jgi:hypothetical protein